METQTGTYLTLKWGTLKSWKFSGNEPAVKLIKEYHETGSSFSAMSQQDTPRQKEIICELIDLCDGDTIYLEWDDKDVSKQRGRLLKSASPFFAISAIRRSATPGLADTVTRRLSARA